MSGEDTIPESGKRPEGAGMPAGAGGNGGGKLRPSHVLLLPPSPDQQHVYVQDRALVWLPGRVLGLGVDTHGIPVASVELQLPELNHCERQTINLTPMIGAGKKETFMFPPRQVDPAPGTDIINTSQLLHINEPSLLYAFRRRWLEGRPFTGVGPVLAMMNCLGEEAPVDLQEKLFMTDTNVGVRGEGYQPAPQDSKLLQRGVHLDAVAKAARTDLGVFGQNQQIFVDGHAMSDKTMAAGQLLEHLCGEKECLGTCALHFITLLNALGHAADVNQADVPRVGRVYEALYQPAEGDVDEDGYVMKGFRVETFLLERCRVSRNRTHEESNFHILHQLLSAPPAIKSRLHLAPSWTSSHFRYTFVHTRAKTKRSSHMHGTGAFVRTVQAMHALGFTEQEIWNVLRILAAILHLGMIRFDQVDGVLVPRPLMSVMAVAELLGLKTNDLRTALGGLESKGSGPAYGRTVPPRRPGNPPGPHARDELAEVLYLSVFRWVMWRANQATGGGWAPQAAVTRTIAIIDMPPSDTAKVGGLYSFLRNFTQEVLLHAGPHELLVIYERELFDMTEALPEYTVRDNSGLLSVYSELFELLGNCVGDDLLLADRIRALGREDLLPRRFGSYLKPPTQFTLKQTHGPQDYNTEGFCRGNRPMCMRLLQLNKTSSNPILNHQGRPASTINNVMVTEDEGCWQGKMSLTDALQSQLHRLIKHTQTCKIRVVCCMVPNAEAGWPRFVHDTVTRQIRDFDLVAFTHMGRHFTEHYHTRPLLRRYAALARRLIAPLPVLDEWGPDDDLLMAGDGEGQRPAGVHRSDSCPGGNDNGYMTVTPAGASDQGITCTPARATVAPPRENADRSAAAQAAAAFGAAAAVRAAGATAAMPQTLGRSDSGIGSLPPPTSLAATAVDSSLVESCFSGDEERAVEWALLEALREVMDGVLGPHNFHIGPSCVLLKEGGIVKLEQLRGLQRKLASRVVQQGVYTCIVRKRKQQRLSITDIASDHANLP